MRVPSTTTIIHVFALLHAVAAFVCNSIEVADTLLLTVLTVVMTIAICLRKGMSTEFTAANVVVANVLGFVFGTIGASVFGFLMTSASWIHSLSSLVTTEILGWGIVFIIGIFKRKEENDKDTISQFGKQLGRILMGITAIILVRVGIEGIFKSSLYSGNEINTILYNVLSNSAILVCIICLCLVFLRYFRPVFSLKLRIPMFIVFTAFTSALSAALYAYGFPFAMTSELSSEIFFKFFTIYALVTVTIYCLVFMINYAFETREAMRAAKGKANLAQYHYIKLKHQLNPHFLFNSLNILECLVSERRNEQAEIYIHKLSGVYRYMLRHEDERTVKVSDELDFLGLYTDLLHVRFPEGFSIDIRVPEEDRECFIMPCSLQLLIENAIKHNAISGDIPLTIVVESNGKQITVRNNIIPKLTPSASTGVGQKYIRQQYLDLCGKEVTFEDRGTEYVVTIPLIKL